MSKYIVTADWHLRKDKPRCRLDKDWLQTQKEVIEFVYKLALDYGANILISGDILHRSKVSEEILNMFLDIAIDSVIKTYILAGQHDLLFHNWNNLNKSSFGILWNIIQGNKTSLKDAKQIANANHFGENYNKKNKIVMLHRLVYEKSVPGFIDDGITAGELLKQYPGAKYIITGDNHSGFVYKNKNRYVINPGCLTIQASDKIGYKPFVVFLDTEKEIIERLPIPHIANLVTDEYITDEEERDERIDAFVTSIKTGKKMSLSFEDNLRKYIKENKKTLGNRLIDLIEEIIEESRQ
jgi:DNA repair exonuclease SbcCD nuclease subunit